MYVSTVWPMMTGAEQAAPTELISIATKASATLRLSSAISGTSRLSAERERRVALLPRAAY